LNLLYSYFINPIPEILKPQI